MKYILIALLMCMADAVLAGHPPRFRRLPLYQPGGVVSPFIDDQTNNTAGLYYMGITNDTLIDWSPAGNDGNLFLGTSAEATYIDAANGTNASYRFVSAPDAIGIDDLLTDIASSTVGAGFGWVKLTTDNGAQNAIQIALPGSGAASFFSFELDMRPANKFLRLVFSKNGAVVWEHRTPVGSLTGRINEWMFVGYNQSATGCVVYLDGILSSNPPFVSTDPTAYFKTVAVDADTDVTTMDFGLFGGSLNVAGLAGDLYRWAQYTNAQTDAHIMDLKDFTSPVQGPGSEQIPTTVP